MRIWFLSRVYLVAAVGWTLILAGKLYRTYLHGWKMDDLFVDSIYVILIIQCLLYRMFFIGRYKAESARIEAARRWEVGN